MSAPAQLRIDDSKSVQLDLLRSQDEAVAAAQVALNDPRVFEVLLKFPVKPGQGVVDYRIEAWFFLPQALGIGPQTYTRQRFYRDLHSQLRVDSDADGSHPEGAMALMVEVGKQLRKAKAAGSEPAVRQVTWKLRLAAAMVRKVLAEQADAACAALDSNASSEEAQARIRELLEAAKTMVGRMRALQQDTVWPGSPSFLRDSAAWVDEYLSLCLEYDCIRVLHAMGDPPGAPSLARARGWLLEVCAAELSWREGQAYPCARSNDEHLVYRTGVLDTFVNEALTLKTPRNEDGKTVVELGSAVAAGLAMVMALSLAAVSERAYGVNTTPFAMAVVVGYMLKDRVKDWLKRFFASRLSRYFADYKGAMVAQQGQQVGSFRETFTFSASVPPEIFQRRHADSPAEVEVASKPETVLRYEKAYRMDSSSASQVYGPTASVTNVVKFNVSELLQGMQPAQRARRVLREGKVVREQLARRYHVNVILLAESAGHRTLGRVRVVMDRDGISRVELA